MLIKYAKYIYLGGLAVLVLVMFIGKDINGAQGWIYIGSLSIQPAELFKLILIIFLSFVLVRKTNRCPSGRTLFRWTFGIRAFCARHGPE